MKRVIYSIIIFLIVFISQIFAQDSMYIHLKTGVAKFLISDIDSVKFEKKSVVQYNYFISKANSPTFVHYRTSVPSINDTYDYSIVYDNTTSINLNDLVSATASNGVVERKFADFGLGTAGVNYQFIFSSSFTYNGYDGITNQNSFIQIQSDGKITVVGGTSAIDRTPVVKVELKNMSGVLLAQAYIKFKILNSMTPPPVNPTPVSYNVPTVTYNYSSLFKDAVSGVSAGDVTDVSVTWVMMNNIYSTLGVSQNQFSAIYGMLTPTVAVKVNDVVVQGATLSQYPLIRSMTAPDVDTYAMKCQITPLAKFGTTAVTYTFTPGNTSYPVLNVTFNYTISKPILDKSILPVYQYGSATAVMTQGMNTSSGYKMQVYLGEAFGYGSSALKYMFGTASAGKIDGATHQFIVTDNYVKSGMPSYVLNPTVATTDLTTFLNSTIMSINPINPLDIPSRQYPVNFKTTFSNGEVDNFNFTVTFMNPFTVDLNAAASFVLTDKLDGTSDTKDLTKNYDVKFKGSPILIGGVLQPLATSMGITNNVLAYSITNVSSTYQGLSFIVPIIKWSNAGTSLNNTVKVGDAVFKYNNEFTSITRIDSITVKPGN